MLLIRAVLVSMRCIVAYCAALVVLLMHSDFIYVPISKMTDGGAAKAAKKPAASLDGVDIKQSFIDGKVCADMRLRVRVCPAHALSTRYQWHAGMGMPRCQPGCNLQVCRLTLNTLLTALLAWVAARTAEQAHRGDSQGFPRVCWCETGGEKG